MDDSQKPGRKQRLEKLQRKLYSPNEEFAIKKRKKLHRKDYEIDRDWEDDTPKEEHNYINTIPKKHISPFAKVLFVAFIFFLGSLAYAFYIFQGGPQGGSSADVELEILGPVSVGSSEPLTLDIIVQNNNPVALETVDLVIEYPDGTKNHEDLSQPLPRLRERIDNVKGLSAVKETKTAALFGEEGTKQQIVVGVEYRLEGSSAIFEKKASFEVILQSSPIRINVDTDNEVTAGQDLEFSIDVTSNSTETLYDVLVIAEYPFGFKAFEADPVPVSGSNVWRFDSIEPNETKTITLIGAVEAQDGEERVFKFNTGIADEENRDELAVIFSTVVESIDIARAFFGVDIEFDSKSGDEFIQDGEDHIQGRVVYVNNLDETIRDARIEIEIIGDVLDETSVGATNGFYKSADNTIVWNQSTYSRFEEIGPKSNGSVTFSIKSKDLGTETTLFRNPELTFNIRLSGNRVNENDVEEEISTEVFKTMKFITDVDLVGSTFYAEGSFENTGPIPPRAEQETTYTIQLDILNTSNDLENARVTAKLPEYVRWNNRIAPEGIDLSFDNVRREITWLIGDVPAGTGYVSQRIQSAFQVTLFPSITQIGDTPALITDVKLIGTDNFTGEEVIKNSNTITTHSEEFSVQDVVSGRISR